MYDKRTQEIIKLRGRWQWDITCQAAGIEETIGNLQYELTLLDSLARSLGRAAFHDKMNRFDIQIFENELSNFRKRVTVYNKELDENTYNLYKTLLNKIFELKGQEEY